MNCSFKDTCSKCGRSSLMINGLENKLVCDICKIEININYDKKKKNNPSNMDNKRTHYFNKMKDLISASNLDGDVNLEHTYAELDRRGIKYHEVECNVIESILNSKSVKNYITAFATTYYIKHGKRLILTKEQEKSCYNLFIKFIQFIKLISPNKRTSTNYESTLGYILRYNKITDLFSTSSNKNNIKKNKNALEWEKFVNYLENEEVSVNNISNIIEDSIEEYDYEY